ELVVDLPLAGQIGTIITFEGERDEGIEARFTAFELAILKGEVDRVFRFGVADTFGRPDLTPRQHREHGPARVDDSKAMAIPLEGSHDHQLRTAPGAVVGKIRQAG